MVRVGLEGGPPRFNFAASLAAFAAICFTVQGLAGFTAQWIQRPTFGSWGKPNCPTVEQVTAAANPWAFDAMLDVDEVTGLCTSAGSAQRPTECPNPLTGCKMGADRPFPCCVFDPNTTSWFASWTRLDRQTTQEQWRRRRDADPFLVTSFAAGSLGWIATVPGVTCLAACLGSAHRSVAGAMPVAIKAAAILSLVEFTSQIGAAQTSAWISDWPALAVKDSHPDSAAEGAVQALEIGRWTEIDGSMLSWAPPAAYTMLTRLARYAVPRCWQALEISYLLTTSQTLWLYSADRLLLASTLLAAAFATFTSSAHVKTMASTRHAALGVFLAVLCIIGFVFDVRLWIDT